MTTPQNDPPNLPTPEELKDMRRYLRQALFPSMPALPENDTPESLWLFEIKETPDDNTRPED